MSVRSFFPDARGVGLRLLLVFSLLACAASPRAQQQSKAPPKAGDRSAEDGSAEDEIGGDFHLNRIVGASGSRLYIAAEAGHLYRSDDAGRTWNELPSPYEGSFFGVLPLLAWVWWPWRPWRPAR